MGPSSQSLEEFVRNVEPAPNVEDATTKIMEHFTAMVRDYGGPRQYLQATWTEEKKDFFMNDLFREVHCVVVLAGVLS